VTESLEAMNPRYPGPPAELERLRRAVAE